MFPIVFLPIQSDAPQFTVMAYLLCEELLMNRGYRAERSACSKTSSSRLAQVPVGMIGLILVIHCFLLLGGCGALGLGKMKWIEKTSPDEHHWLVKDIYLTAGSAYLAKEHFDHKMNDSVNFFFTPTNEKNHYVAKTVWYDPSGTEYRTIRTTYDLQREATTEVSPRKKGGTPRMHSMTTKELFAHKPGLWTVALYIDDELARRLTFSIR